MLSIKKLFRTRTVESITAPITSIVTELKEHAEDNATLQSMHEMAAAEATKLAEATKTEAARALAAADKFAALVA